MQNRSFSEFDIKPLLFSFDKDFPVIPPWGMYTVSDENVSSLHYHNALELGYCYKGTGVLFVQNKILPFYQDDVSVIFEYEPHIAKSHKDDLSEWKFITIDVERLLSGVPLEQLAPISKIIKGSKSFQNIISTKDSPDITYLIGQIIEEVEAQKEGYHTVVTGLVLALMIKLTRLVVPDAAEQDYDVRHNHNLITILPALNYLSKNYYEQITIEQLASLCNISVTHFRRIFKTVLEVSPMEYLFHIRIKMAVILLSNPDYSITDIAMQVGYQTVSCFNKHFKRITGVAPREWRKL